MRALIVCLCVFAVAGCRDPGADAPHEMGASDAGAVSPGPDTSASGPFYHRDVAPILAHECVRCHRAGLGAVALDDFEHAAANADAIAEDVSKRTMPPFLPDDSGDCDAFVTDLTMSEDDVATLERWAANGAPEGPPAAEVPYTSAGRLDASVKLGSASFTPSGGGQTRCFVLDVDPSIGFVTGFDVQTNHPAMVHDVFLFDIDPRDYGTVDDLDGSLGYDCPGGPGVDFPQLLGVWAPGRGPVTYPEGTGIVTGQKLVMQVHYTDDSAAFVSTTDVYLGTTDKPVQRGYIVSMADLGMAVPPGMKHATAMEDMLHPLFGGQLLAGQNLAIRAMLPYMRDLGQSIEVQQFGNGDGRCLLRTSRWDPGWTGFFQFRQPVQSHRGDVYRIRCDYDTSEQSRWLGWGPTDQDEVCAAMFYVTLDRDDTAVRAARLSEPVADLGGTRTRGLPPAVLWSKRIGYGPSDFVMDVKFRPDGDFYAAARLSKPYATDLPLPLDPTASTGGLLLYDQAGTLKRHSWIAGGKKYGVDDANAFKSVVPLDDGDAFVTGNFLEGASLDGTPLVSEGKEDAFLGRLDADGHLIWHREFGGLGHDEAKAATLHFDETRGHLWTAMKIGRSIEFGGIELPAAGGELTPALVEFDTQGVPIWGTSFPLGGEPQFLGDSRLARIMAIDLDAQGNVYFGGFFRGQMQVGDITLESKGFEDGFVGSFSPQGALRWVRRIGDRGGDQISWIQIGPDGDLYAEGWASGPARVDGQQGEFHGGLDGLRLRIGTDGTVKDLRQIGGPDNERLYFARPQPDGGWISLGGFSGVGDYGGGTLHSDGANDLVLVGYARDGHHLFSRAIGTPASENGRDFDQRGNLLVLGSTTSLDPAPTQGARLRMLKLEPSPSLPVINRSRRPPHR